MQAPITPHPPFGRPAFKQAIIPYSQAKAAHASAIQHLMDCVGRDAPFDEVLANYVLMLLEISINHQSSIIPPQEKDRFECMVLTDVITADLITPEAPGDLNEWLSGKIARVALSMHAHIAPQLISVIKGNVLPVPSVHLFFEEWVGTDIVASFRCKHEDYIAN